MQEIGLTELRNYCWRQGDLSWQLDSLQLSMRNKIHELGAYLALILASRQLGKSYLAVIMALEWCMRNHRKIARIVAPTLKQAQDIVNDNLTPIVMGAPDGLVRRIKSEYRWVVGTCELRLGALERQYVDGNRGGNASLIIYEECGFVKADDFNYGVNSVLGPQLLRTGGIELYISSPSEDPEHPLHTIVLPRCAEIGTAFRYTVYDSPSLTPALIQKAMDRCGGEQTDAWQREYLAKIIRPKSLVVIPSYDEIVHVQAFPLPTYARWQVTIDWGGVRDMTVALLHCYDPFADTDLIWDEREWPSNTPTSEIVRGIREMAEGFEVSGWYADIPGQLQVDLASAYGLVVCLPPKEDWRSAVVAMSVRFSLRKILIHPRCLFLRRSCRGGIFNKSRTDFERKEGYGHMDALAALMYAIRVADRTPFVSDLPALADHHFLPAREQSVAMGSALAPRQFPGVKSFMR